MKFIFDDEGGEPVGKFGAILMAVFRPDPALLRRQVQSLRQQSLKDWNCYVGIDGTDPSSCSLLQEAIDGDPRFTIVEYAENVGHYRNFERLTERVPQNAGWVVFCDQDDYWYPEKLKRLTEVLRDKPSAAAAVASARLVDQSGNVLGVTRRMPGPLSHLLLKNEVTGCLAMFRPDVIELALPFPAGTGAAVHDHWLAVCAAALGDVVFCREILQDYVQHSANVIGEPATPTIKSHLQSLRRDGGLVPHLDTVSRERWGWRVVVAKSLAARLDPSHAKHVPEIAPLAAGRLTRPLFRHLMSEVSERRLSLRDGLSMAAAALWWPLANRERPQASTAGRHRER